LNIKVINNLTDLNHEKRFKELLKKSDSVLISSPYLILDFGYVFNEIAPDKLKEIKIITTLLPKSLEQIKKIKSLVSFIKLPQVKNGNLKSKISLNNKLHGKVYIFKKDSVCISAIITSANFTYNGLVQNHEWGIEIEDHKVICEVENDLINSIEPEFEDITSSHIFYLQKQLKDFLREGYEDDEEIDIDLTEILKAKQEGEKRNQNSSGRRTNEFKITQGYLASWAKYFNEFMEFKKSTNEVTVPRDYKPYGLYKWYRKQKVFYTNGKMPPEHREKLEKVGFYFGDGHELYWAKVWEENYGLLEAYYEEYGNSDVPHTSDKSDAFYSLGNWVALQKTYNNNGVLSDYKIERLNDLNFLWKKDITYSFQKGAFEKRLEELKEWKEIHGDCHVPQINPDKTQNSLGRWLNDQRVLKRKGRKNSKGDLRFLDKEKELLLSELGVDFNYEENKHKNAFEKQIQSFLSYRYQHPDLKPPPGEFKKERENLAQWRHKFDKLSDYKQKRLKELKIIE
jgi:hypothetical protein